MYDEMFMYASYIEGKLRISPQSLVLLDLLPYLLHHVWFLLPVFYRRKESAI